MKDETYLNRPRGVEVAPAQEQPGRAAAHATYACMAAALFTAFPLFIAPIIAYITRGDASPLNRSHLTYNIRTFWWTLLWTVIGTITVWILIGWLILGLVWLWAAYRIVKGWLRLFDNREV